MQDDILNAPVRMVAIHSGKYEFADVLLDAPLHLMGPNNIGKTTLIAMLQFLYLDNYQGMHFSHSRSETKRYYFPHTGSYILFECRTAEGFRVVAVHGLGPARQYDFERFSYRGKLELDDFLDAERQIREPDAVKARLAAKGYTRLEPRHLRAALSGVGDDREVRLGLVPLRDRSQYERFRFLFCNLLRLAQLRQDALKELLIEIYRNEFQQLQIDLSIEYRERFARLDRDAQTVRELRLVEKNVRRLFELVAERDEARGKLPVLWQELGRRFVARETEYKAQKVAKQERREQLEVQELTLKQERTQLSGQRDEHLRELGVLSGRLQEVEAERAQFVDFMPDWAVQRRKDLERETAALQAQLGGVDGERPERIERRIAELHTEQESTIRLRDSLEKMLLGAFRKDFSDEQIGQLFRLLNPALLELAVEAAEVRDEVMLKQYLQQLLAQIQGDVFEQEWGRLDMVAVPMHDVSRMTDPEVLRTRLEDLAGQISRETGRLAAARDRVGLEKKLKSLQTEATMLDVKLARWEELEQKGACVKEWTQDVARLTVESEVLGRKVNEAAEQLLQLEKERQQVSAAIQQVDSALRELLEMQRRLTAPAGHWQAAEEEVEIPADFSDLYEMYRRIVAIERRLADETQVMLAVVQDVSYGRCEGDTEAETLQRLREAVDALDNKELALHKAWTDMAVGLRSSFSALGHDLERLQGKVRDLNRRMGQVEVSNLMAVRLIVREHPEWTRRIQAVCDMQEDLPLFGTVGPSPEMEALGALLEQTQLVQLTDLFDLHFEIQGADQKTRMYTNLDKIESNGTTITIKVLVHLMLLRDLMSGGRARIPFYLDEVSSLDHDNIAGIIRQARALDFTPILASPESVEEVDRIYVLSENEHGKMVLDGHALIELQQGHE